MKKHIQKAQFGEKIIKKHLIKSNLKPKILFKFQKIQIQNTFFKLKFSTF